MSSMTIQAHCGLIASIHVPQPANLYCHFN